MYAKKHRPMQKLTAICLSVTIAAASLLSGHVFASDEAPQTDYLTGWELLAELREMGLGQDVILDEEAPESDNSSETNTEDPSDTTGESGDGDQTDGTEPGNPGEGGSDDGDTDPGESTPEQPGDGDQTGGTEPGTPDGNNPGEGGSDEGDTDTDTDPGTDNPGEQPDNSDPAAGTDPDQGDGAEQGSDQNQPSAPAGSTESASGEVPLVTHNDEMTVNDPQIPGETPASEEDNDKDPAPSDEETPSEDPGDDETTTTPGDDNTSQNPDENPGGETTTPPEGETGDNQEPSGGDEIDPGFGVDPSTPIEEIPETSGITEEQRAALEAYVQTLEAEQVVSLDETDITTEEYEDLYSMLTSEQLAAIELLLAGPNGEEIYSLIMAAQTLDEVNAILDSLDQAGLNALFGYMSEEQYAAMMDWIDVLEQAAIEAALSGGSTNFTNAAPLVGSTSAGAPSTVIRRSAARAALYAPLTEEGNDALELSKRVEETDDGYQLVLEAYATGEVTTTPVSETVPTDIVLVLDQSGSMAYDIKTIIGYKPLNDTGLWNLYRNRNNLYVKVDGEYYKVAVTKSNELTYNYTKLSESATNSDAYDIANDWRGRPTGNLVYQNGDEYLQVTVSRERVWYGGYYTYTYSIEEIGTSYTSDNANNPIPEDIRDHLYERDSSTTTYYTFSYYDADGQLVQERVEEDGTAPKWAFYTAETEDIPRLDALKEAVSNFITSVQEQAEEDEVNHRIAIVGFASDDFNNTEVLTGVTIQEDDPIWDNNTKYYPDNKAYNGVQYDSYNYYANQSGTGAVQNALLDVTTTNGQTGLNNAVNALTAHGGTQTDDGLEMAADILAANPVPEGEQRNQVVILFTDGVPTGDGSDFDNTTANGAISAAKSIKNAGATVYTIGIFDGADASNPESLPSNSGNETSRANRFMHLVSSNYPNASNMNTPGEVADLDGDGYYLSASDADALNEIFQTISDQIDTPSTSVKLDGNAVLRDVITPYFQIPTDESATAQVYKYEGSNTWAESPDTTYNVTVEMNRLTNTVDVTGYDYSTEYIWDGETTEGYGGSKLVVTIPIEPDPKFLGGNAVPTNETTSGIYASDEAQGAFETFPVPSVNVPIHYSFDVTDKTIYLSNSQAVDFGSGEVFHDDRISAIPLGGTARANDYVNIVYTVSWTDDNGAQSYEYRIYPTTSIGTTTGWYKNDALQQSAPTIIPKDCTDLTITCEVKSKNKAAVESSLGNPGEAQDAWTPEVGEDEKSATVHVLKPTLHFQDSYYPESNADDRYPISANRDTDFVTWSDFAHPTGIPEADSQKEPQDSVFTLTFDKMSTTSEVEVLSDTEVVLTESENFKVNTVIMTVGSWEKTLTINTDYKVAEPKCSHVATDVSLEEDHVNGRHFTIHLPSEFNLTITKTLAEGSDYTPGETFRFTVESEETGFYTEFTLGGTDSYPSDEGWTITITGLKRGTYTIEEDTGWSWRYQCSEPVKKVAEQQIVNNEAEVTFTNKKKNNHWLSWEDTIQNIFKAS